MIELKYIWKLISVKKRTGTENETVSRPWHSHKKRRFNVAYTKALAKTYGTNFLLSIFVQQKLKMSSLSAPQITPLSRKLITRNSIIHKEVIPV